MSRSVTNANCNVTEFSTRFAKSIGAVLHVLRVKRGLTQASLVEIINDRHELGVQQSTVSKIEQGSGLSMGMLAVFCDALTTNIPEVVEYTLVHSRMDAEGEHKGLADLKDTLRRELRLPPEEQGDLPSLTPAQRNIYRELKHIIVNGVAAGHVFTVRGVMQKFDCITRTARAAFDRLHKDGYVQRLSADSFAKSGYDTEYLVNVMRRRLALESEVLTSMTELLPLYIDELKEIHHQMASRECNIDQEASLFIEDDVRFHQVAFKIAGKAHLVEEIGSLTRHTIIGLDASGDPKRPGQVIAEHNAMITAIESGSREEIYGTLRTHLLSGAVGPKEKVAEQLDKQLPHSFQELQETIKAYPEYNEFGISKLLLSTSGNKC